MLREQINLICAECGLTQKGLAEVIGVDHQRVRNIATGRVEKLTREECEALIRKLHISADWLATGSGPMFKTPQQAEDQDAFVRRMQAINTLSAVVDALPIAELERVRLKVVLTGDPAQDAALIAQALGGGLKPEEAALLDNYRHAPKDAQEALAATSAAFAQRRGKRSA